MEGEIINIATLTIDSEKAVGTIEQTKKSIFDLQKANTELRKEIQKNGDATGEQTKQFVSNEAELKKLNSVYKDQQNAMNSLTLAQVQNSEALTTNSKSVAQANAQNRELIATRNQINATTDDGRKAIALINEKLDQNNAFIRENSSQLEKQKQNVGNYGMISKDLNEILGKQGGIYGTVRTQVEGFRSTVSGTVDTVKSIHNSVVTATQGLIGFKTAQQSAAAVSTEGVAANTALAASTTGVAAAEEVATVATGTLGGVLGALLLPITAVVAAGLLVYNVFKDFGPLINPIKDSFAALGSVFTVLKSAVFDLVTGARSLGEVFSSLGSDIADTAKETYNLEAAQRSLTKAMNAQEVASARTATRVKELILQAKDLSKSAKERQDLLNKAQKLEENEFNNRFKNYKKEKELAIARLTEGRKISEDDIARIRTGDFVYAQSIAKKKKLNKEELENLRQIFLKRETLLQEDNQIQEKAQNYKNKIIEKDQAKQEKAAEKARKDADDAAKAEQDRRLKALNNTVIIFEQEKHSVDQQLEFYKKYYEKLDVLQGGKDKVKNANDLSLKVLAIAENQIKEELDAQKKSFEEKKKINEDEKNNLIANADFLKATEIDRINNSLLSERDKAKALAEIQTGYLTNVAIINENFKASEKQRIEIEKREAETLANVAFEMKLLGLEKEGQLESELQKAILTAQLQEKKRLLDEDLANEKKTAEEVRALKELEDKKYAVATKKIDKEIANAKRANATSMVKDSLNAAAAIFGENKAVAVAMALVNTYEGIAAGVKLGYPAAIPAVASAAATGFAAVKNILKTDKGTTSGSGSSGGRGSSLSTPTAVFDNPAKTQTIAKLQEVPQTNNAPTTVPVLVLESLDEVKGQQQIKIKSN
jgi:hypothetical protein